MTFLHRAVVLALVVWVDRWLSHCYLCARDSSHQLVICIHNIYIHFRLITMQFTSRRLHDKIWEGPVNICIYYFILSKYWHIMYTYLSLHSNISKSIQATPLSMLCNLIPQLSLSVYQRQVEERMKQIHDLEESTLSLDDHAKRLHKQFRLNRENYERSDVDKVIGR